MPLWMRSRPYLIEVEGAERHPLGRAGLHDRVGRGVGILIALRHDAVDRIVAEQSGLDRLGDRRRIAEAGRRQRQLLR